VQIFIDRTGQSKYLNDCRKTMDEKITAFEMTILPDGNTSIGFFTSGGRRYSVAMPFTDDQSIPATVQELIGMGGAYRAL